MRLQYILTSICWLGYASSLPEPEAGLDANHVHILSRMKRGGACTTTADCVSGNVCSKWGWCQWTSIYGSDGPSQGSSAPGGGTAGQCVTSADCASRVPYCSKLGFCHGGRLPFDEAQLEIDNEDKEENEDQPQGFINNNPRKNNPSIRKSGNNKSGGSKSTSGGGNTNSSAEKRTNNTRTNTGNKRTNGNSNNRSNGNNNNKRKSSSNGRGGGNKNNQQPKLNSRKQNGSGGSESECPGGNLDSCIDACIPIKKVAAYGACVTVCGSRCK